MKIIERQFTPKSFNYEKGVAKFSGEIMMEMGDDSHMRKIKDEDTRIPSPDLLDQFDDYLKDVCVQALGICDFMALRKGKSDECQKAFDVLNTIFQKYYDNARNNLRVTGIKFTGTEKTEVIVLNGKRILSSGKEVQFKTPGISLNGSVFGFEENLKTVSEYLKSEIFSYVFMGKIQNPSLGFDGDEDEDEDED